VFFILFHFEPDFVFIQIRHLQDLVMLDSFVWVDLQFQLLLLEFAQWLHIALLGHRGLNLVLLVLISPMRVHLHVCCRRLDSGLLQIRPQSPHVPLDIFASTAQQRQHPVHVLLELSMHFHKCHLLQIVSPVLADHFALLRLQLL
jgi:hypothetical protein